MKKSILVSLGAIVVFVCSSLAYGPTGHEIVGGIADKLLANTPTAARVNALIDGITLEKASVIADEIRGWDKNGVDGLAAFPDYSDHPKIDKQLRDFWRANPPTQDLNSAVPSHHWFHYTDVPVLNAAKYSGGKMGRSRWDIVHMINYCIAVLQGETPENDPRKITKPVAVILLAHYVGDIHQPLHVGAEYFDEAGHAVDPDKGTAALGDEGGNTFALYLKTGTPEEMTHRALKLHPFWDNEAVMANLPSLPFTMSKEERYEKTERAKRRLIDRFTREEPTKWRLPGNVALKNYAEAWADEILPIAREAHERLRFTNVHAQHEENGIVAAGVAREKSAPDHVAYADWAAKIVREEMHKAGWRLADLLQQTLTPANASDAPIPTQPNSP
jgi:S1/P1 Nuclease